MNAQNLRMSHMCYDHILSFCFVNKAMRKARK